MKEIYYFIKTLKTMLGRNFYPIMLAIFFTIFLFIVFGLSSFVNAEDYDGYSEVNYSSSTFYYVSTDTVLNFQRVNTQGSSLTVSSSNNTLTLPVWLNEYNFFIGSSVGSYASQYYRINVFISKGDISCDKDRVFTSTQDLYYFKLERSSRWTPSSLYDSLDALKNQLTNPTQTATFSGNLYEWGFFVPQQYTNITQRFIGPNFYISNFDLIYPMYSTTIPFLKSSFSTLYTPVLFYSENTFDNIVNQSSNNLSIDLKDFVNNSYNTLLRVTYKLPDSTDTVTTNYLEDGIWYSPSSSKMNEEFSYGDSSIIWNVPFTKLISEYGNLPNGTEVVISHYGQYTGLPDDIQSNPYWSLEFTIGGSYKYTPAQGEIISPEYPDEPSGPDYTGQLEDIDSSIKDGFDSVLDSDFTVGEFPPEHSMGGNEGNYLNFIDLFFTQMQQVFTYDLEDVETISLEVPFVKNGVPIKISSDLLSSHLSGRGSGLMFYTLLQGLYAWIFTRYIFIFCFNIINKFKSGQFMDGSLDSNDTMINNML